MWLTLLFGLLNLGLSLIGRRIFRLPGFDLTPLGIILIAQHGESILFGALVLTVAFSAVSPGRLRFLWLTLPATLIVGYLALAVPNLLLLLLLYHIICAVCAFFLRFFGFRYTLFVLVNLCLNLVGARVAGVLF